MKSAKIKLRKVNNAIIFLSILSIIILSIVLAHRFSYIILNETALNVLRNLIMVILTLLAASIFLKLTNKLFINSFKNTPIEQQLLLTKFYSFVVYFIAVIIILGSIGLSIQNLTLVIGITATGLAFTIREILINYFAWFMFLTKKPFRIGDHIQLDNIEGKIIHIGTFYVLLDETPEDSSDFIRIPNKKFLEHPILNFGKGPFTFYVNYPLHRDLDVKKIDDFEKRLNKELKNDLNINLITDQNSVKIEIKGKTDNYQSRNKIRTEIIKKLMKEFPFKS